MCERLSKAWISDAIMAQIVDSIHDDGNWINCKHRYSFKDICRRGKVRYTTGAHKARGRGRDQRLVQSELNEDNLATSFCMYICST